MKKIILYTLLALGCSYSATAQVNNQNNQTMDRTALTKEIYHQLFGGEALTGQGTDPELMNILQKFIFGDVFHTGVLNNKQRELITVVTLVAQQALPQLKAHANAALNVGVTPIELREAVYQCAPYIGYPRTLNAVGIINEVFTEKGIQLPLENKGTVNDENRFEKGKAIQHSLYGDEIKQLMSTLPGKFKDYVPKFQTEADFGDYYTRRGLDVKTRELLMYCVLATINADFQLKVHAKGCLKAGVTKEELVAAMVQCIGYIGLPNALNAINSIKNTEL
ncbi:MAG: carboxymuconolactone decarboxylase family protein [Bacteroidetes bacterium]|nr:carboxymuconolactone decarboxylase family protein [Bacteroidota bacterium]